MKHDGSAGAGAPSPFVNHRGAALVTLDDWQALHRPRHWRAGYSAMELARAWHGANGFPDAVARVLGTGPFGGTLVIERAIAECRTPVPGAGLPSHTDLMVEARAASGQGVVIAVEGKVRESFGPLVSDWLLEAEHERSAANRARRLAALCAGLGLPAGGDTERLHYQLLHRTWAALRHATSTGARHAVLLVHSFSARASRFPTDANQQAFGDFLGAMGHPTFDVGVVLPLGLRMGVGLSTAWVSDTPLATPRPSSAAG